MRTAIGVVAALAVVLAAGAARAEQVTEPHTKTTFDVERNIGGEQFLLVGVGARRAGGMINVYGAGMYVGVKQAVPAWQGYLTGRFAKAGLIEADRPNFQKLTTSAEARHYIVYGRFPKAIEMAFVRDVSAEQVTGAYNESWDRVGLDQAAAGEALTQFMAAINGPMTSGQRMMLRTTGNSIFVTTPRGNTRIAGNNALVTAIWKIWFGNPCLQAPLRDGMLANLERIQARLGGN